MSIRSPVWALSRANSRTRRVTLYIVFIFRSEDRQLSDNCTRSISDLDKATGLRFFDEQDLRMGDGGLDMKRQQYVMSYHVLCIQ